MLSRIVSDRLGRDAVHRGVEAGEQQLGKLPRQWESSTINIALSDNAALGSARRQETTGAGTAR